MSAVTKVQKWLKGNKKHISAPIADHAAFFDLFNGVNKPLCTIGYIQFQWNCGSSALADVNIGTTVNIGGVVNIFLMPLLMLISILSLISILVLMSIFVLCWFLILTYTTKQIGWIVEYTIDHFPPASILPLYEYFIIILTFTSFE